MILETIIKYLKANQSVCYFKSASQVDCPGCGLQTSIIALLEGDVQKSFLAYPALMPIILTILWLMYYLFINNTNFSKNILLIFIAIDFILIFGAWIFKLLV